MDTATQNNLDKISNGLTYLACPMRHEKAYVEQHRVQDATRAAAWLTRRGATTISPITHSMALSKRCRLDNNPIEQGYDGLWKGVDDEMLVRSDALVILTLDGWEESEGVNDEIHAALDYQIPIYLAIQYGDGLVEGGKKSLRLRNSHYNTPAH